MPYLDTSVLVAALTAEANTTRMQEWLAAQIADDLAISAWVATEFSAALSIKVRTGAIDRARRSVALAAFARLSSASFRMLPVTEATFRSAARFADQARLGLRAGDALHLAIVMDEGLVLATLDKRLADAGAALGVPTDLL